MHSIDHQERPALMLALRRGLFGRCPNCGDGRLFASYLKQVDRCAACGEAYKHIRSDDAAPWLTILIVGHVLAPFILWIEPQLTWPLWMSLVLWCGSTLALTFLTLPRAKGVLMSAIWSMRAPGSEKD